ncbi:MAG: TIR domain-containing protein [Methyloceanibacter sp.]|uniref:TIR domain-containing protein n=1 Tax=Methyloceanibacter sp. TaxID=1965321 RepID=UPI003D6CB05F
MSGKDQGYDAFVSYAKADASKAHTIVAALEARGLKCWVAPRDVRRGHKYASEILRGIEQARAFILVLSQDANDSKFVCKEVERAVSKGKPVLTIRVADVEPSEELEFFISDTQWTDAWSGDLAAHVAPVAEMLRDRRAADKSKPARAARTRAGDKAATRSARKPARGAKPGAGADVKTPPDPQSEPEPGPRRWPLVAGLVALVLIAALAYIIRDRFVSPAAPHWTIAGDSAYLGEDVRLAWTYDPPKPGMSLRFELESAGDQDFDTGRSAPICTDSNPYFVGNLNGTRFWRVRAVTDCVDKTPVSAWSEPIAVTQYESVYDRIKATGKANIYVSNSQDQDVFKWGDHGFDIKLAKLILRDLSTVMDRPITPSWRSVPWPKLLPSAGDGTADFVISSITKKRERERKFNVVFSESYFCTTHALIYPANLADAPIADLIAGKKVGVQGDTTNAALADALTQDLGIAVVTLPNTETLRNELLNGQIDFAITDTTFARSAQLDARLDSGLDRLKVKEFELADMPNAIKDEHRQEYGLAVRRGEVGLLAAIDKSLAKAKEDGTLAALFKAASEEYELAKGYRPGSRGLGAHPWECVSQTAGGE